MAGVPLWPQAQAAPAHMVFQRALSSGQGAGYDPLLAALVVLS